MTIMQLSKLVT